MKQETTVIYRKQDLITISDVARRWGVSRQKVYNMIDEGRLKAFRFGFSNALHVPLDQVRKMERGEVFKG